MKYTIKTTHFLFFLLLTLLSCNSSQTIKESRKAAPVDSASSQPGTYPSSNDDIIEGTLTSKEGKKLRYRFDKQNGTMIILFDHDSTILKQDTSASGIKYSNQRYTYNEWHGHSDLIKDGKTLFTADR